MFDDVPSLEDLGDWRGTSVLLRADLNVALARRPSGETVVADDFRLRAAVPTIDWLLRTGAFVTVASHLGRPHGHPDPALAMAPVRGRLLDLLPHAPESQLRVLENLRFDPGEEANDPAFGAQLVAGHDRYVNDAFGCCHRAHASVVYPPSRLPSAAGRLLRAELRALGRLMAEPPHPFTVVAGGAKVADKIGAIGALAAQADGVLVGGAMAFTFMVAAGRHVGSVTVDPVEVDRCRRLLDDGLRVELPVDLVAAPVDDDQRSPHEPRLFDGDVPAGWRVFDIGPRTAARFADRIAGSAAVLWNGPLGVCEDPRFAAGTRAVAEAVAGCAGTTVVGGGETVAAVRAFGVADRIDHVSTGGGAMLELIERGDLPGIAALRASWQEHRQHTGVPRQEVVRP